MTSRSDTTPSTPAVTRTRPSRSSPGSPASGMREKPDGSNVEVTIGDMSRVTTGRTYGLVYLVYNTIGNLLTQDDQVRCFENAARHLAEDGVFVLECRVPVAPSRA